jgi:hypothetical protein
MDRNQAYDELTKGGPGHDGYAYNCEVYCPVCGAEIIDSIIQEREEKGIHEHSELVEIIQDTNDLPAPIFFGESDSAEYCANCGKYLYGPEEEEE